MAGDFFRACASWDPCHRAVTAWRAFDVWRESQAALNAGGSKWAGSDAKTDSNLLPFLRSSVQTGTAHGLCQRWVHLLLSDCRDGQQECSVWHMDCLCRACRLYHVCIEAFACRTETPFLCNQLRSVMRLALLQLGFDGSLSRSGCSAFLGSPGNRAKLVRGAAAENTSVATGGRRREKT